ncbi:MAG: hypothetical protein ABW221_09580 [Vicinamibacteria bacterium]
MRSALTSVGAVVAASLLCAPAAEPCDAMRISHPARQALSTFRYVYAGKVVQAHSNDAWTVELVRVWKGSWPGKPKRIEVENRQGMCGTTLGEGQYYLFYTNDEDIGANAIQLWSEQGQKEVTALDRVRKRHPLIVPKEALEPPKT